MKIGEIVTVDVPMGTGTHVLRPRKCKVLAAYDKKQLGVMYLLETLRGGFKTCVVVPPAPRYQPEKVSNCHRWSKKTKFDQEIEGTCFSTYDEMLDALGLDKSIVRSKYRLKAIADMHGCEVIENGN